MVDVKFVDTGYALPGPASQVARLLKSSNLEEYEEKNHAQRQQRHLFVARENDSLIAFGRTSVQRVLSSREGEVLLSESSARHSVIPTVQLSVGRWYELAIDPASGKILAASQVEPLVPVHETGLRYKIDLYTLSSVTHSEAKNFFSRVRHQPHIPFQYPLNGCWARAHEMARLIESYFDPDPRDVVAKIWNFGPRLSVKTGNNPFCEVEWRYHVAPVVKIGKNPLEDLLVIDPALFEEPVPVDTWRCRQSDLSQEHLFTTRHAYKVAAAPPSKPLFAKENPGQTEEDLQTYRDQLFSMIYCSGPLPYNCEGR